MSAQPLRPAPGHARVAPATQPVAREPVSQWVDLTDPLLAPMLAELTAEYVTLYGPGAHHEMARHPAEVFTPPSGGVVALVVDGVAVAAGAFRQRGDHGLGPDHAGGRRAEVDPGNVDPGTAGVAEIKRMWTASTHRRRGLARRVLVELEEAAADAGYTTMYLSTGWRQDGAIRLYLATGYRPLFDLDGDPAVPFERGFVKSLSVKELSTEPLSVQPLGVRKLS